MSCETEEVSVCTCSTLPPATSTVVASAPTLSKTFWVMTVPVEVAKSATTSVLKPLAVTVSE